MTGSTTLAQRSFRIFESVRCLECGGAYAKPVGGGTAAMNPGCPDCGYLGWLPLTAEVWPQLRYVADHRLHRPA